MAYAYDPSTREAVAGGLEVHASLGYIASSRIPWAMWDLVSRNKMVKLNKSRQVRKWSWVRRMNVNMHL